MLSLYNSKEMYHIYIIVIFETIIEIILIGYAFKVRICTIEGNCHYDNGISSH